MDIAEAMSIFVAVCEAGGFAPAARRLGLSPSVVTRRIAGLEGRIGVRLLDRTTRSLRLTEAGGRYLERARHILADIEESERLAQSEALEPRGRLSLTAPIIFGRAHVAPLLTRFLALHPRVEAALHLSDRVTHLIEDGHDLAIRIGNLPDSSLIAKRLGQTRRLVVASPAYLAKAGEPRHPGEVAGHEVIAFTGMLPASEWRFVEEGRELRVRIAPRLATDSGDVAIAHALEGGGLTRALSYQVTGAIAAGTLVEVLAPFAPPPLPIHAVYPSARLVPGKVRAFIALIEESADWRF